MPSLSPICLDHRVMPYRTLSPPVWRFLRQHQRPFRQTDAPRDRRKPRSALVDPTSAAAPCQPVPPLYNQTDAKQIDVQFIVIKLTHVFQNSGVALSPLRIATCRLPLAAVGQRHTASSRGDNRVRQMAELLQYALLFSNQPAGFAPKRRHHGIPL